MSLHISFYLFKKLIIRMTCFVNNAFIHGQSPLVIKLLILMVNILVNIDMFDWLVVDSTVVPIISWCRRQLLLELFLNL